MKKITVLILALALLFPMACTKKEKDRLSSLVPSDTQVYLKIASLSSLHQNLNITENSIMGKTIPNISFIETGLGFNPLKLEDLQTQGVDVNRSLGLILSDIEINSIDNKEPDFNAQVMLFLPVSDYDKFIGFIKETIQKIKPEFNIAQLDDITVVHPDAGKESILFTQKNNYMIATVDPSGKDSTSLLDAILSGESALSGNKDFQQAASKLDKENNLFVYVDTQSIIEKFLPKLAQFTDELPEEQKNQMEKGLEFTKDYTSAGFSIDLNSSDLRVQSILNLKPGSKILEMMHDVKFNKDLLLGIDETPLFIFSFAYNLSEYLDLVMGTFPPENKEIFEETKKQFQAETGLDLEKDVIENIEGSMSLGIFDAENINLNNTNTILTIGIKDESKAVQMFETFIEKLPDQQKAFFQKENLAGTDAYVISVMGFFRFFIGITNNSILLTADQSMFEQAVSGKSSSGFGAAVQEKKLADILSGDYNIFYINIDELMKAQKNLGNLLGFLSQINQKIIDIASQFEYLLAYSGIEETALYSEFVVKTRFENPFIQGIMNIFNQINN